MANDTSRRPWSLDTAAVISTDRIRVQSLKWVTLTGGVDGDNVNIEDANGEIIWQSINVAATDEFIDTDYPYADFEGFEVAVIDRGILYVTYG